MLELLAPAGSMEAVAAAVQNGTDAVYLGYGDFNARRNAKNFSEEEFAAAVSYCHLRGAKVYLTLNTLLTDRELPKAAEVAAQASAIGADAVLIQDLGVLRMLRQVAPDLPVHASTQMTLHNLDGVKMAADLGLTRAVLSRELSRDQIEYICQRAPIEIEVFAHGALCMCYSGQCFLSSVIGGRSGNRGLCAQPCRLAYRWPGDRQTSHPLSLKDLSLAGHLGQLEEMGVACLKIEGRMKRPEYVAVVTAIYAAALREHREPTRKEMAQLEAAFSRQGFTQGYFLDRKGPAMFGTRPEGTRDPADLFAQAKQFYTRGEHRPVPVTLSARGQLGEPVTLTARDADGHTVTAQGAAPQPARTRPVTGEQIAAQLAKTGGTVYAVQDLQVDWGEGLSLPLSAVNALRREVLAGLDQARTAPPARETRPFARPKARKGPGEPPAFTLSFRRWEQLSPASLDQGPALVYLPVQAWASHEREGAELTRAYPDIAFGAVLPRMAFDREGPALRQALEAACRAGVTQALLGHVGQLALARAFGLTPRGDFGLGFTNTLTGEELARLGFASATASFECRLSQIRDLGKALPTEAIVYGRLPLMLMEHCILKNRGQGCHCEEAPQALQDRKGEAFPVEPAWGCRNELFNAKTLWLADKADWKTAGLTYARLAFLRETPADCARVFRAYRTGAGEAPAGFTRGLYYRGVE